MNDLNDFQKKCLSVLASRNILNTDLIDKIKTFIEETNLPYIENDPTDGLDIEITFPKITLRHFVSPPKYVCKLDVRNYTTNRLKIYTWTRLTGINYIGLIRYDGKIEMWENETLNLKHIADIITDNKEYVQNSIRQALENNVKELK